MRKCKECGKEFRPFDSIQAYCSYPCYKKKNVKKRVSKPQPSKRIKMKKQTKERDGYQCRLMGYVNHGKHVSSMDSHHIIYLSEGGVDEAWNLITLCSYCHHHVAHRDKAWQPKLLKMVGGDDWYEKIDQNELSQSIQRKLRYFKSLPQ